MCDQGVDIRLHSVPMWYMGELQGERRYNGNSISNIDDTIFLKVPYRPPRGSLYSSTKCLNSVMKCSYHWV